MAGRRARRAARVLLAAAAATAIALLARIGGVTEPLDLAAHDTLLRWHATAPESPRLALVTGAEEDIARFGWPLPDGVLAALLERLVAAGAGPIAVDLYRDRPVGAGADALEAVLARNPGILWVTKLPEPPLPGVPPPAILAGTRRAVAADLVTDAGGVVRRGLIAGEDVTTGAVVLTLGAAMAEALSGERLRPAGETALRLGAGRIALLGPGGLPHARADTAGYQVLLDFRRGRDAFPRLTIAEVLDGAPALAGLAGRGVVVGADAVSVRDNHATPLTTGLAGLPALSGAAIHAHLADQLLRAAAGEPAGLVPATRREETGFVALAALAGAASVLLPGAAAPLALAVSLLALAVATSLAFGAGLLLPGVPGLLALLLAAAAAGWALHGASLKERARLRRAFAHYLDPRIIAAMVEREQEPGFGGEQREITVLFSDLAGFTGTAEALPPAAVAGLLNDYFDGLTAAVVAEGGLVANLIGDGMLAIFGAPLPQPDHAARAVAAAARIDAFARRFEAAQAARGVPLGATRIGVHTGIAMVGNLGTRARLQYGAIGDVVNLAQRLEGLNKQTGTRIAVSAEAARAAGGAFRPLGAFAVKGRASAVEALTPVPARD